MSEITSEFYNCYRSFQCIVGIQREKLKQIYSYQNVGYEIFSYDILND